MDRLRARLLAAVGVTASVAQVGACAGTRDTGQPVSAQASPSSSSASAPTAPIEGKSADAGGEVARLEAGALSSFEVPPGHPAYVSPRVKAEPRSLSCKQDEVREVTCFNVGESECFADLEPGETLPEAMGTRATLPPLSGIRVRDRSLLSRPRNQRIFGPTQACCYSGCYKLEASAATPERDANAVVCFGAPESGTSLPAAGPNQRCPKGIAMPGNHDRKLAFDAKSSVDHSANEGEAMCCYGYHQRAIYKVGRALMLKGEQRRADLSRGATPWGGG